MGCHSSNVRGGKRYAGIIEISPQRISRTQPREISRTQPREISPQRISRTQPREISPQRIPRKNNSRNNIFKSNSKNNSKNNSKEIYYTTDKRKKPRRFLNFSDADIYPIEKSLINDSDYLIVENKTSFPVDFISCDKFNDLYNITLIPLVCEYIPIFPITVKFLYIRQGRSHKTIHKCTGKVLIISIFNEILHPIFVF